MLFYFKYITHDIEKLHELLVFFFDKVETDNPTSFDTKTLFPAWYSETTNRLANLEKQLKEFLTFERDLKLKIIESFRLANRIAILFSDKSQHIPTAKDFDDPKVTTFLNNLFTPLYDGQLSPKKGGSAPFPNKVSTDLHDHYKTFREDHIKTQGTFTLCPFCGLEPLRMRESEPRPDYDHILPKGDSLFVFSSVNMRNLVPIGSTCNKLKNTFHLLYDGEGMNISNRTLAFYPYDDSPHPFELINFNLVCSQKPEFRQKGKWCVTIKPNDNDSTIVKEKIDTWLRVFKIQKRYSEYIGEQENTWRRNFLLNKRGILQDIKNEIQKKLDNDLLILYYKIATTVGIIPERLFHQWALNEEDYLKTFAIPDTLATKVDIDMNW